eukprot:1145926-Pelagomonas_calceolata.AAC.4
MASSGAVNANQWCRGWASMAGASVCSSCAFHAITALEHSSVGVPTSFERCFQAESMLKLCLKAHLCSTQKEAPVSHTHAHTHAHTDTHTHRMNRIRLPHTYIQKHALSQIHT